MVNASFGARFIACLIDEVALVVLARITLILLQFVGFGYLWSPSGGGTWRDEISSTRPVRA
ncbi:MAG: hypothetical protein P8Y10_02155 [Gemmatimonadales bacterium]|jgi:hypothetical protein